jgi:hypothetical protein
MFDFFKKWFQPTTMNGFKSDKYYSRAFSGVMSERWKGIREISTSIAEIESLCYYRALTAFYGKNPSDIEARRALLYEYLAPVYNTEDATSDLNVNRGSLPIGTTVRRLMKLLCTAYNEAPKRDFGGIDEGMQAIYTLGRIDVEMKKIYKKAKLCGMVAIRPVFVNGKLKLLSYTPDDFRVAANPNDTSEAARIVYLDSVNNEPIYRVWDAEKLQTLNIKGKVIGELTHSYERLPFVFLCMDKEHGFYAGGMFEIVEENIKANEDEYDANLSRRYHAHPIGLAINMGADMPSLAPSRIVQKENVRSGEAQEIEPMLQYISPEGRYAELKEFAEMRLETAMRNEGIPASSLAKQAGTPVSGIARVIERSDLLEERYDDIETLRSFERDLAELIILVSNTDAGTNMTLDDFSVDYADEQVLIDPDIEYELDKKKMNDGVVDPVQFFRKWGSIDKRLTENELITLVQQRKETLKKLGISNAATDAAANPNAPAQPPAAVKTPQTANL